MKVNIVGGGWYGCNIAVALCTAGHDVELFERGSSIFSGASGANPARLHMGFHYSRSKLTRAHCQAHQDDFLKAYGTFTRAVPINIYAVAAHASLVDFGTYHQIMKEELECINIMYPSEFGLANVEGALLTGERHIDIMAVKRAFEDVLADCIRLNAEPAAALETPHDVLIDCTFCANDAVNIDRYEPCIMGLYEGPTNKAVTIMDGPFPSFYPWNDTLVSLTSAKYTPLGRCDTYAEAEATLARMTDAKAQGRLSQMADSMSDYYPSFHDEYHLADYKLSIRAMPWSGADSRLVDIVEVSERHWRVRAGKIDAILYAADEIQRRLEAL